MGQYAPEKEGAGQKLYAIVWNNIQTCINIERMEF